MQSRLAAKVDQKTICCRISNVRCTKMKVELLNRGWEGIYLKSQAAKNVFRFFSLKNKSLFSARFAQITFCLFATDPLTRWNSHKHSFEMWRKKWNFWLYLDPSENRMHLLSVDWKTRTLLRYVVIVKPTSSWVNVLPNDDWFMQVLKGSFVSNFVSLSRK